MMRQLVSALAQKIDPFPFFLVRDVKQPLTVIIASSQTHHVHQGCGASTDADHLPCAL